MKRWPLRTRLTLWFAASLLVILGPALGGVLLLEWSSMRAALDHHLKEDLEVATQMLVRHGEVIEWRLEGSEDPGYDAGVQRWVEVYDRQGAARFIRGLPANPEVRAAVPAVGIESAGLRTIRTPAGAYVRTLTEERRIGREPVWLRVARSEDGLRRDLRWLVMLFTIAGPTAVLAAALAGYIISGRALAPLARMAERARSISADHLSERLPVENAEDEPGRLALVFNETFARLEASFERLKRFTADASHELRTPLTAIRSVGEVALREPRDTVAYQETIGSMLEEVDRLARVVDTLLTLSRWESGRVRPAVETVDLAALASDVAGQLAVLAEDREVSLDVRTPHPMLVRSDPTMARLAVMNIIDNAIKFTRPGGTVAIWSRQHSDGQDLVVDDQGPGIPPDQRERVLERFYRVGESRERGAGGAGLGLAIVHWALTANGGRIHIDDNPAGGTRIALWLPPHTGHSGRAARL